MPITRSQARSGQPPNRAASLRANPLKGLVYNIRHFSTTSRKGCQ